MNGLTTIRAYKAEEILTREFDSKQDTHTGCQFMIISTVTTFGFYLDVTCTIFIFCIVFYYMLFDTGVSGEKVGLAISQAISISGLISWGM